MRVLPSVVIGFVLTWSAAWFPARAQTSGATFSAGSLTIYEGHAGGMLTVNGQTSYYSGGSITNVGSLSVYNSTQNGVINVGTLTKTGSDPISLNPVYTGTDPILALSPNTTLTTGSTLSLAPGSTVSFNGTVTGNSNLTFNSGATLVTNASTTVNSGVVINTAYNSYLASTGLVKTGAGTLIVSNNTVFSGGTNATVTGGTLIFGNGGTVTSGGMLNIGTGSILSPTSNLTIATTTTTTGGILDLGGGGTLKIGNTANILTLGSITPVITNATLGAVLLNNNTNVGGTLILNGQSSYTLTGSTLGFPTGGNISLGAGSLTISPTSTIALTTLPPIHNSTPGSLGTTVKFLDAALSSNGASILFLPAMQNLASDRLSLHIDDFASPGAGDKIVLQLTFDPTAAAALGDLTKLYLAWYDPADGLWKNAIDGNSDGGASSTAVTGAYHSTTDFNLGTFGVDTANSTVWAVIDHDGTFAVASSDTGSSGSSSVSMMSFSLSAPEVVPEPSTAGLLLLGLSVMGRRSRRR